MTCHNESVVASFAPRPLVNSIRVRPGREFPPVGPLAVDPEALFAAGSAVVAAGEGLNAVMTVLTAGFGANTGQDIAGEVFGLAYQSAAESLLKSATAAVNACQQNGAAIQIDGSNWSQAEAASTLGGGAGVLQAPAVPAKIGPPGPPGTLGPGEPPPPLWALVQPLVDSLWPDGDAAGLHAAAGCWRAFGAAVAGMGGALSGPETLIGTQQMPEGFLIIQVLSQMKDATGRLSEHCGTLADRVDDFANDVANAQNNIRDLLHRLGALADVWHDVMSILDGDMLDEIKKIVKDINAVLHDLGREARAFEQGIRLLMKAADGLVVDIEKLARRELTHFLGDEVGNPVATVFDTVINTNEGILKGGVQAGLGMVDLGPGWLLLDPKGAEATWKGTLEGQFKSGLLNEILHPKEGGQANVQMWKSLLHLDDWSTARPGLGAGENAFDALTLLIPGAGEAGAGVDAGAAAARSAEGASEFAEGAGAAGRAGEFAATSGALGDIGKVSTNLTKDLEGLKLDLPKTEVPAGGRPVGAPPVDAPGAPAPRPVESAPPGTPAPHSPTAPSGPAPGRPGTPVGPHEPAPAPGGPHELAPAPGGSHEPLTAPRGPHEASSAPSIPADEFPSVYRQPVEPLFARSPTLPESLPVDSAPGRSGLHGPGDGAPGAYPHESPSPALGDPGEIGQGGPSYVDPPEPSPRDEGHGTEPEVGDPGDASQPRHPISGHGAYDPAHGDISVPRGTTVTVYAEHGSSISDALGNLIETGGDTSGMYSKTFTPGDSMPNYTIYPPDGLNIMGSPQMVQTPTHLSDLINEDMGPVDLAVCTYDPTCPTGKIYDVAGVFDEWTGIFNSYERPGY